MTTKSIRRDPILEALFTSRARVEVLKLFLLNPSNRHYLREVASLTRQPVRAVQRELARLETVGLLLSTREGNRKYFQANHEFPVFPELKALFVKTAGLGDLIRVRLLEGPESIVLSFIFGSFARGEESSLSDIDVMVVGDITGRALARILTPAKEELGREINPVIMRTDELQERIASGDPFMQNVLREPKIFLVGGENELRELAGARPIEAA
ncbi:MAG: nucleotidyltransferase domain-containing protein [Chloroflexi bacterium]|nr:nucleotidyltransferase domain-containing protein [Chloroflexota bacterium]